MGKTISPLRYPGGKSQIIKRVRQVIENNHYRDRLYVEPFSGGFGVGLSLLASGTIQRAVINDSDVHIYHFWQSVLNHAEELIQLVNRTPITLDERATQKNIYSDPDSTIIQDGFATLYLNRVNYSGVLFAGPLGGNNQASRYPLGCRFNKADIIQRIRTVFNMRDRIELFNLDASNLITNVLLQRGEDAFYNIDPPYVIKGKSLYNEYFTEQEHRDFSQVVQQHLQNQPWIITYDNCDLVRELYQEYNMYEFELYHSARIRARGTELVITNIPDNQFTWFEA